MRKLMYVCVVLLLISKTTFAQWQEVNDTLQFMPQNRFVAFSSDTIIAGVGNTIIKSVDGAVNWDIVYTTDVLANIFKLNDSVVFALHSLMSGQNNIGKVLKSTNRGTTWDFTSFTIPNNQPLQKIWFLDENVGFGISNFIYRTTDGGLNWTKVTSTSRYLTDITFSNIARGFVGSNNGTSPTIIFSTNGGSNWFQQVPSSVCCFETITSIQFVNNDIGYAIGDNSLVRSRMFKTTNGGTSWTKIDSLPYNSRYISISFVSPDTGYAIKGNYGNTSEILKTTDGGLTWNQQQFYPEVSLRQVIFASNKVGYALGIKFPNGSTTGIPVIYKTTNGGVLTSLPTPSPTHQLPTLSIYPNPITTESIIQYTLKEQGTARLSIIDILGKEVSIIATPTQQAAGNYELTWQPPAHLRGMYLLQLQTPQGKQTKKIVVQ